MNRVFVIGTTWRTRGVEALEEFTVAREDRAQRLPELRETVGASELVYIATCNRVEVALVGDGRTSPEVYRERVFQALTRREPVGGEAARLLTAWAGEGAAEHLFLVTAGLDSARIGEREIMAQIRDAVDLSRDLGLLGRRLDFVFHEALRIARRAHVHTGVGTGKLSLAAIAADEIRRELSERVESAPVALVGVSPMTERCGNDLRSTVADLLVVNRSLERAETLAKRLGGTAMSLDAFRTSPPRLAAVVLAVGSAEPVLDRAALERLMAAGGSTPPLLVDMGIPANVDPGDAESLGCRRVGMDAIVARAEEHRGQRLGERADARTHDDR